MSMVTYIHNTRATYDYEILETLDAGAVLLGCEVKSLRHKLGSLQGSYITIRGTTAYLLQATIPPFQQKNAPADYTPTRERALLLTQKEIAHILSRQKEQGLTLIPLKWYNNKRHIKLEIAVARGKKKYNKRESIKKRDVGRDLARETSIRI